MEATYSMQKGISVKRIAILGMFLALMIGVKYVFGFVPGIELVSFLFIIFGLFLPFLDLTLLLVCFNILVGVIYGFGNWWFAYWIIWPVDALISKGASKITKNRFVFSIIGFFLGASVGFWYFFSDMIFFGTSYAVLNIITAIPVNIIEGLTTMILLVFLAPPLIKVMNTWRDKFWGTKSKPFVFKEVKWRTIGVIMNAIAALAGITGIVLLFVFNGVFIDWKRESSRPYYTQHKLSQDAKSPPGYNLLNPAQYNSIYGSLNDHEIGISIIANGKIYSEKILVHDHETVEQAMDSGKEFKFRYDHSSSFGAYVLSFQLKGESQWRHGTATTTNYGDNYPMYFINHKFSNLGVSNFIVQSHDMYEFTYDHNS